MKEYTLHIIWSEPDNAYVATCPEFPGLSAFGATWATAAAEANIALAGIIEVMVQDDEALPKPMKWIG